MRTLSRTAFALTACAALLAVSPLGPVPVIAQPVTFISGPWPPYASEALTVDPEPTGAGVPTELCAHLYNNDTSPHDVTVQFYYGSLGIAPEVTPIGGGINVTVPALSEYDACIMWVPPSMGPWSHKVRLSIVGYDDQVIVRSIDAGEPLEPLSPHPMTLIVRNPLGTTETITLGLVPHLPDWGLELSQDVFPNVPPGGYDFCTLTSTPPADLLDGGVPIVDVEGYIGMELIGGFRKIVPVSYWCPGTRLDLYADAARINAPGSSEERGAYVTAKKTASLCALGWEADFSSVPGELVGHVYRASGTTRGELIASGTAAVTSTGMQMHMIPLGALLEEGQEYDFSVEFSPTTWVCIGESQITLPFEAGDVLTVRDGEAGGNAGNTILGHFAIEWSPAAGGTLAGVDEGYGVTPRFRLEHLYPNPASDRFFIEYRLDAPGPVSVEVYDVAGRRVALLHRSGQQPAGPGRIELDSSTLAPGAYFVKLNALGGSVSRKFVVVK